MQIENNSVGSVRDAYGSNASSADRAARSAAGESGADEKAYEVATGEKPAGFEVDYKKISALKAEYNKGYGAFRQMVSTLLQKQGSAAKSVLGRIFGTNADFDGVSDLGQLLSTLDVDEATRAEAASLIGEDGAWGVKQVSENILNFAKAAAGGDPEKLEKMRNAFLKGFAEAEKVWGGCLPDISYKTKEAVLAGFDALRDE